MRNLVCVMCLMAAIFFVTDIKAQTEKISKSFPKFEMKLTDGSTFKSTSVKNGAPVLLIYFSPTCEHCQKFVDSLLVNMQSLKSYQIVLVTYVDIDEVKKFEVDNHLKNYKNIIAGSEGVVFTVRYFFNVVSFPFTAVYNKEKTLVAVYRQPPAMQKLKNLK